MKNWKLNLFVITFIAFFPMLTYAEPIINNNGVVISEEEYENFLKVHTPEYIMTMTQEKYEKLKSFDFNNIKADSIYVKSTYNDALKLTTQEEITEEEFNNFDIMPILNSDGVAGESVAKSLSMYLLGGDYWNYVLLGVAWKGIPKVRSFDVIGFYGDSFEFRNGSQTGEQTYGYNGKYSTIYYDWNANNTKLFDNGFGISMNIVDNDIDYLTLEAECDITPTANHGTIFGSYQHATSNITLAKSQKYTLGAGGYGMVFMFDENIAPRYDDMFGLRIDY